MRLGKRPINRSLSSRKASAKNIKTRTIMRELMEGVEAKRPSYDFGDDCAKPFTDDDEITPGTGDVQLNQKLDIALKFPNDATYAFHIGVWRMCCPSASKGRLMVTRNNRADEYDIFQEEFLITFDDPEAQKDSVEWWDAYKVRHGDLSRGMLPRFNDGDSFSGYAYTTKAEGERYEPDESNLFPVWCWMIKNTTGKIVWTADFWFFEDATELCQFKLASPIPRDPYNF